jgi:hypothetical protein
MSNEQIGNFLEAKFLDETPVMIKFKIRAAFKGLFIKSSDYKDLKAKNFWRVVPEANIENFKKSGEMKFTKIFSGFEITKLSAL